MRTWSQPGRIALGIVAVVVMLTAGCDYDVGHRSGELDETFGGGDGVAIYDGWARSDDRVLAAARRSDGRVVMVIERDGQSRAVAQHLPDGTLDPSFGDGGIVRGVPTPSEVRDVVIAPDGDVVIVGALNSRGYEYAAAVRLSPEGSPDGAFGVGGVAQPVDPSGVDLAPLVGAAAIGDDVYVLTWSRTDGSFLVARLGPDGALDTGFGSPGTGSVPIGPSEDARTGAIRPRPDGSLAVAYETPGATGLVAVSTDGQVGTPLDTTGLTTRVDEIKDVDVAADGSVVVTGVEPAAPHRAVLVRSDADMTLDTSFGTGGAVVLDRGPGNGAATALTDGGIVFATSAAVTEDSYEDRLTTVGLTSAGALDPGWGTGGTAAYDGDLQLAGMGATPAGVIVAGTRDVTSDVPSDPCLLAVGSDGHPDPSFGDGGWSCTDIGGAALYDELTVVRPLPGGDLFVAGDTGDGLTVGRYDPDGTPDADHPPEPVLLDRLRGAYVVRDVGFDETGAAFLLVQVGSGVPTAEYGGGGSGWRVVKLSPDGTVDESFGEDGVASRDGLGFPHAVAIRPDGTVLVAHTVTHPWAVAPDGTYTPPSFDVLVDGLAPGGAPEPTWGAGGTVTLVAGAAAPPAAPSTGWMDVGPGRDTYLVLDGIRRLDAAGAVLATPPLPAGVTFAAADLAVDDDGAVVAAGRGTPAGGEPSVLVARFDAGLQLDPTFGADGLVALPPNDVGLVRAGPFVSVRPDGTVTVAEHDRMASDPSSYALAVHRLTASGAADTSYGGDGRTFARFRYGGTFPAVNDVSVTADGDVVAAGATSIDTPGADTLLARVNG